MMTIDPQDKLDEGYRPEPQNKESRPFNTWDGLTVIVVVAALIAVIYTLIGGDGR